MISHYGVTVQDIADVTILPGKEYHSFYYHVKEMRILGSTDEVNILDLCNVCRVNTRLIKQRDITYITVLGDDVHQLMFICNGVNTRVSLFEPFNSGQQGATVLMNKVVSEPVLGLSDLVNLCAEMKTASSKDWFTWQCMSAIATRLLAKYCEMQGSGMVKAIYRKNLY